MSNDEYQQRQFFLPTIKWTEMTRSPDPKSYKYTGLTQHESLWF